MKAMHWRTRRRWPLLVAATAAVLTLGACNSINEALDGINPISRTLDKNAKKKTASGNYRQPLAIPPDYSLRPPADKAETRRIPEAAATVKKEDGEAVVKVADPKKIDLGISSAGDRVSSTIINTRQQVVTNGRTAADSERSMGEKELLKRPEKN